MTAVKQAACSRPAVRRHQTTGAQTSTGPRYDACDGMAPDERRRRLASDADLHWSSDALHRRAGVESFQFPRPCLNRAGRQS